MATLTIGGSDKSTLVPLSSVRINDYITQRVNTCSFKLVTPNTYTPEVCKEIVITSGATKLFGGYITNRTATKINSTQIEYSISCQDYSLLLMHKLAVETYEDKTCAYIINDLITTYCSSYSITQTNVSTGPTLDRIQFNYITVFEALKKICKYTGYDFYIDYNKDLHFFLAENNTAPFNIIDSTDVFDIEVKRDLTNIRNAVYVRGGTYLSDTYTQNEKGNGTTKDFYTTYKPHDITVTVGGASKTVGIDNIDDSGSFDCLLNYQEKMIKFTSAPADGSAIVFTYKYDVPILVYLRDSLSIAALAALGDADGIREHRIKDNNIATQDEARNRAEAEIRQYANPGFTASYKTKTSGVYSGMIQNINSTLFSINTDMVVTEVNTIIGFNDSHTYEVTLEGKLYGLTELLADLLMAQSEYIERDDEILDKILVNYETIKVTDTETWTRYSPPHKYGTAKYGFSQYGDAIDHYKYGGTTYGTGKYA
jgi:hypothetical protein